MIFADLKLPDKYRTNFRVVLLRKGRKGVNILKSGGVSSSLFSDKNFADFLYADWHTTENCGLVINNCGFAICGLIKKIADLRYAHLHT